MSKASTTRNNHVRAVYLAEAGRFPVDHLPETEKQKLAHGWDESHWSGDKHRADPDEEDFED